VAADPIRHRLRARRLRVREIARAQHRDEELDLRYFPSLSVDDAWLLARVVDKEFLARPMHLPHRELLARQPFVVMRAERRVAEAIRMLLEVLEMQKLQRHPDATQFDVQVRWIRQRTTGALRTARSVQPLLKSVVAERSDLLPIQSQRSGAARRARYRAVADAEARRHLAVAPTHHQFLPKNLSYLSHAQSLRRHLASWFGERTARRTAQRHFAPKASRWAHLRPGHVPAKGVATTAK
jgi:hypothetical protein